MTSPTLSIIVIGRNEGQRLIRCLGSIRNVKNPDQIAETIYVDSGSTDGSPEIAASFGVRVISLNTVHPTAALGRETGWRSASSEFILFLDGDTILHPEFPAKALDVISADPTIAAVWGQLREVNPAASLYNRVLDLDWIFPIGEVNLCGGNVLVRRQALEVAGGYDTSLIAGEEPELCCRIRAHGYHILNIDVPMVGHDLAMTRFRQYWKRSVRTGYAYAEVSSRYQNSEEQFWQAERVSNLKRGIFWMTSLPVALAASFFLKSAWPNILLLVILLVLSARSAWNVRWKSGDLLALALYGLHSHFQQIPICIGQMQHSFGEKRGKRERLIEYKENA
jgi:glycosyltransferase involved in cell wall biosynthesis